MAASEAGTRSTATEETTGSAVSLKPVPSLKSRRAYYRARLSRAFDMIDRQWRRAYEHHTALLASGNAGERPSGRQFFFFFFFFFFFWSGFSFFFVLLLF